MNKYKNLILLLLVLWLSSCIWDDFDIYIINKSKEDVYMLSTLNDGEVSTQTGAGFLLFASGDTLIHPVSMEAASIYQLLVLRKSTYEMYSEEFMRQHDVYDMRKVYSRDDLKRIGYKIEITDFDLRIPKNDEHDN